MKTPKTLALLFALLLPLLVALVVVAQDSVEQRIFLPIHMRLDVDIDGTFEAPYLPTVTFTVAPTSEMAATSTSTLTPTTTNPSPVSTITPTATELPTDANATSTPTPTPTETDLPPVAADTPTVTPTETDLPPVAADTPTPTPTETDLPPVAADTPTVTPTETDQPPVAAGTPTPTPTETDQPPVAAGTPTVTLTETDLPPVAADTPTVTPTETEPAPAATYTPTPTPRPPSGGCTVYNGAPRSSHFGVQMYGNSRPESQFFDSLLDSGAGWVRIELIWASAERENVDPEDINWTRIDRAMAAAAHANVNVIATVNMAPDWAASAARGPFRPGMLPEFVEFVSAFVERYDGDGHSDAPCSPVVNYIELYNEPDHQGRWGNNPDKYAEMLEAVYPAIKAANPNAQVVIGGVAQDHLVSDGGHFVPNWVRDVLAAGGGPYFDVMNIHTYPAYYEDWADYPPGALEKVEFHRQLLRRYGFTKPIIITETGFHSTSLADSLLYKQSILAIEILTQARVADVRQTTWFTLYDIAGWANNYTGLVTYDNPPRQKPVMDAYLHISAMLESAVYVHTLTPATHGGQGYLGYEFYDSTNRRTVFVAWAHWFPGQATTPTQLRFAGTEAYQYDIYGNRTRITDASDGSADGFMEVRVAREPVILTIAE